MSLNIDELTIRNFRSFGDVGGEETYHKIDLKDRGPILITGEVDSSDSKSNGAGKTSIVESIIWCLFGRLSYLHNPASKIVNWEHKKNCLVNIHTSDGYDICRTRDYEGYSDLSIKKDGSVIDKGDSTNKSAQNTLNSLFDLDFHTFITSMFFGQSSGSFLSLSDQKKKSIVENLFGLSKLSYYAKAAKARIDKANNLSESVKKRIDEINKHIEEENSNIADYESLSSQFEEQRDRTIREHEQRIESLSKSKSDRINIESLELSWELIGKSEEKLDKLGIDRKNLQDKLKKVVNKESDLLKKKVQYTEKISSIKLEIDKINDKINRWNNKRDKICPSCEQEVPGSLVDDKVAEIRKKYDGDIREAEDNLLNINADIEDVSNKLEMSSKAKEILNNKIESIDDNIEKLQKSIKKNKSGKMTIIEAKKHNQICDNVDNEINRYTSLIDSEKNKKNDYMSLIQKSKNNINKYNEEKENLNKERERIGKEASHLTYIYRAHSDKRNIRSFLIAGSIPILNNRLSYYFNELEMDSCISFNKSLQIKSDRWPYELHSGGEKKRVDLALMCAIYDTFVSIHGQQSNILVLDEIDKDLDKSGVDEYVKLVIDDLSNRIGTILIISHKNEINYAFPTQIKVKKEGDISFLEQ